MSSNFILIIVLLLIVVINFMIVLIIKKHIVKISKYSLIREDERDLQVKLKWESSLYRVINICNIVTLIGGLMGIYFSSMLLFSVLIAIPVPLGIMYVYSINRRPDYVYPHNKKGYVVIFFVICILLISMWGVYYQYRSDLVVSVSETELKISGLYGTDIMYDDIQEVTLQNRLPLIKLRSNGFAVGNIRLGNFITKDDVHVILFAHSDSCFIRIVTKSDNIYYLSAKKPDETIKIFRIIKKNM